jgi:prepilin-type N-terminal cleavage/methylation domain-containing protein
LAGNRRIPAQCATRRRGEDAGFTLVELTIALVVMGIAAGLALPMLSSLLSREGEKTTARVLQGVLRRTQAEALLSGRDWRVDIDWARGKCRAVQLEKPLPGPVRAAKDGASQGAKAPTSRAPAAKDGKDVVVTADLPDAARPSLVLTAGGEARLPEVTSLVLRPQGLCQPAFIQLADVAGKSAALAISAVGCRVELVQADLDAARERFAKAHARPRLPWGDDPLPAAGS